MTARLAVLPLPERAIAEFLRDAEVVDTFVLPPEPWSVHGVVCRGVIADASSLADAVAVAVRGADLLVDVAAAWRDALLDAASRASLSMWTPDGDSTFSWACLLDELIDGASIDKAARRCHVSRRSAYRLLDRARADLGVSTTTAAVSVWAARRRPQG
jgi:hypothetical protein